MALNSGYAEDFCRSLTSYLAAACGSGAVGP